MNTPLHVLLVADDPQDQSAVIRELSGSFPQLQLRQVTDAEGFSQALQTSGFDLVIIDSCLQWSDGLTALRTLKTQRPDCPAVMLVGADQHESAAQAVKLGLDSHAMRSKGQVPHLVLATHLALDKARQVPDASQPKAALIRSRQLMAALGRVSLAIQSVRDPDAIYRLVAKEMTTLGHAAVVLSLTEDGSHLVLNHLSIERSLLEKMQEWTGLEAQGYRVAVVPGGLYDQILRTGKGILTGADQLLEEALPASLRPMASRVAAALGWQKAIDAPMIAAEQPMGLLAIVGEGLTEADMPAVETFACQVALAVENATLYKQARLLADRLEQRAAELGMLNHRLRQEAASRTQIQEQLREATQYLQALLNATPDQAFLVDLEGTVLMCNEALANRLVKSVDQALGTNCWESLPADEARISEAHTEMVACTGQPTGFQLSVEGRTLANRFFPVIDMDGRVTAIAAYARDITLQQRAERELRESEERYRGLFEWAPTPLWEEDWSDVKAYLEGLRTQGVTDYEAHFLTHPEEVMYCEGMVKLLDVSESALKVFGASCKEHLLTSLTDFLSAEGAHEVAQRHLVAIASGAAEFTDTIVNRTPSGELKHFVFRWLVQPGHERALDRAFVSLTDVTNLKRTEEALKKSEARSSALLSAIPDLMFRIRGDGTIVDFRPAPGHALISPAEEFLGEKLQRVAPPEEAEAILQLIHQALQTGEPQSYEYEQDVRGDTRHYEARIAVSGEDEVVLIARDVTQRKRSELRLYQNEKSLRALLNAFPESAFLLDTESTVIAANETVARRLGARPDELVGSCIFDFVDPGLAKKRQADLERVIRTGQPSRLEDVRSGRSVESRIYPVLDGEGRTTRVAVLGLDVTERKRAEAELLQSTKLASMGLMAGGIAHQVRNPLAIISACAQLILEKPQDRSLQLQCANKIRSACARASQVIESLLQFARPEGQAKEELDVQLTLHKTLDLLGHHLATMRISLHTQIQPNPPAVQGNAALLQQVFTNIVLNACDAMHDGGELHVSTRAADSDAVEVIFRDTGRGIPPDELSRVFDPFFSTKPATEAAGLGLTISQSIIRKHGGSIDIQSQVAEGTVVTVRLPMMPRSP
jgi:PAS domain S-box-containing protein